MQLSATGQRHYRLQLRWHRRRGSVQHQGRGRRDDPRRRWTRLSSRTCPQARSQAGAWTSFPRQRRSPLGLSGSCSQKAGCKNRLRAGWTLGDMPGASTNAVRVRFGATYGGAQWFMSRRAIKGGFRRTSGSWPPLVMTWMKTPERLAAALACPALHHQEWARPRFMGRPRVARPMDEGLPAQPIV